MTPRSPQMLNETSGAISQAPCSAAMVRATDSCSREWRTESIRSSSPPRQRGARSSRTSSAAQTERVIPSDNELTCPPSIRDTVARETRAASARSC